ncbi:hypothetical protein LguiB_014026 [Lonicera macranthoides]
MATGKTKKARFSDSIMPAFANFSDDILFTIFLNLPVKSILRFKVVCKSWCQLLSDPLFIKMHRNRTNQCHQRRHKFLLKSSRQSFYSVDLETSISKTVAKNFSSISISNMEIVGSCNGLLCLAIPHKLVLWNPLTGDYKKLPAVKPLFCSFQTVGFGYDSSIDDYKIVRIVTRNSEYQAFMYLLKANSWKIIPHLLKTNYWKTTGHQPIDMVCKNYPESGVYLNGFIYWVAYRGIICCDLKNEKLREVPWHHGMERRLCTGLSMMGGYLVFYQLGPEGELDVWELKEYQDNKEEWMKLMTIPSTIYAEIRGGYTFKFILPVCFLDNGKVLFYRKEIFSKKTSEEKNVLLKAMPASLSRGTLLVYDPKRNSRIEAFPIQGISDNCTQCVPYIESLVSPNFV